MQLSRNSYLTKFYLFWKDTSYLPDDFCTFFWGLVEAMVKTVFITAIVLMLIALFIIVLVQVGMIGWAHKSISMIVILVGVIGGLIGWRKPRFRAVRTVANEIELIVETKVDSVKNRYCPKIEWTSSTD